MLKISTTNPCYTTKNWKRRVHLKEADEIGEDEEGGGVVDPLEEAKEDESAAVDDEARWEYCLHPPY